MSESNNNTPMRITQLEEATSYPEGSYIPIAKAGWGTKKIDASVETPSDISLKKNIYDYTGNIRVSLVSGERIATSGDTYNKTNPDQSSDYCYAVVSCNAGDEFILSGSGGYSYRLWAFGDGTNILTREAANTSLTNKIVTAPEGATELIFNSTIASNPKLTKGNYAINKINNIYNLGSAPTLNNIEIKTINVFDSFLINSGAYSFNANANINNYRNYAAPSSIAKNTPPIKIRDYNGNLIYKNLRLNLDLDNRGTICAWLFGKDGYYLRSVDFDKFYDRDSYFLSDEYYAILNLYPTVSDYSDYKWIVDNVNIEWLNNGGSSDQTEKYYVGSGGDFATITEMLTALENNNNNKIVYIMGGEYDIFEEMGGASYMAELENIASTLNWRDVCKVVPPNTKLVGVGNVVLKWIATAEQMKNSDVAWLFSPLNLSGNCTIENITVIGQNCRYAVHDEASNFSEYDGAKHYFKDCVFECLQSVYQCNATYGSGHNKNMVLAFDNCTFINYQNNAWTTHNNTANKNQSSTIDFNNCIFKCSRTNPSFAVQFITDYKNDQKEKVSFNNCYFSNPLIRFYTASSTEVQQGYDIKMIGCTNVETTYSSNITTRYEVLQYNSFS